MKLFFQKVSPTAILPQKASEDDAGYDLFADLGLGESIDIFPGNRALIPTGIAVAVEDNPIFGTYFRVAPRSGHAHKNGIDVLAGVVDSGYRGGVGVILLNTGTSKFTVPHGMKIAQGIVELIAPITEVVEVSTLPASTRGAGGFGSTGN